MMNILGTHSLTLEIPLKIINTLVVDDDPILAKVTARLFRREGHNVTIAHDGYEGLTIASAEVGFDLLVTDLQMPRMDGLQLLRKLGGRLPAIVASGAGGQVLNEAIEHARMSKGRVVIVRKPYHLEEMRQVATRLLSLP